MKRGEKTPECGDFTAADKKGIEQSRVLL